MKHLTEYSEDLEGFVITFRDGAQAQTQYNIETNRLDAGYGERYLERYTEYDDDLTDDQDKIVNEFVKVNKWKTVEEVINN